MVLSETGFKEGSYEKIKLFSKDVGNLQSIKLITRGSDSYRCDNIKIESEMDSWNFECEDIIKCPKCSQELFVVSMNHYEVTVKTSSIENSGTSVPIYIQFWGTDSISPRKLLSDKGLESGSIETVSVETMSVGNLYAVSLSIIGYDEFLPDEIIVKYANINGKQERVFRNKENEILENSEKSLMLKLPKPNSDENEEEIEEANKNFNSILSSKDKLKVANISCVDVLKDNQYFGPRYVTNYVNYSMYLVKCPSNCLKYKTRVYGLGIHPEESPICISAIIDRAVSFYGGIIGVNVLSGIAAYTGGKNYFGYQVESYGNSKRSYTITRVDNNDMINKDVRILDYNGNPSYKGRVELRNNGVWGTICNQQLDQSAAKVICLQIGYKEGTFLGTYSDSNNGFCSNYEGMDFCGADNTKILFSHLTCQGNESDIFDCYRQIADTSSCNHKYDTIIECMNTDIEVENRMSPGTIRLIDYTGNPTQTGIGRLEILNSTWGTICNRGFDDNAATVACKQMGFNNGKIFGVVDSQNMCGNVLGSNLCGEFSQTIKYTDVKCSGNEKSFRDCNSSDNTVSCTHFNDVIIKCEGIGDTSGKSQNVRKPKVLTPLIEKLPMQPAINAKCNTTIKDKYFRGDPGSVYLVNCPSDCAFNTSSLSGTGVYTIDSSICKAAIHTGIISNEGGNIIVNKTFGQNKFFGSSMRRISSLEAQFMKVGFFISEPTSAHYNLAALFTNFSGEENNISFLEMTNSVYYKSMTTNSNVIRKLKEENGVIPTFSKQNKILPIKVSAENNSNIKNIKPIIVNKSKESEKEKYKAAIKSENSEENQNVIDKSENSEVKLTKNSEMKSNVSTLIKEIKSKSNPALSSFIEIETKQILPARAIYEWAMPNNEFSFNGSKGLDLMTVEESKKIFEMKTFTIAIKFRMEYFSEKSIQTLFSIGGCEGYSIVIDTSTELVFNVKCGSNVFRSGVFIPLSFDLIIYLVYDGNNISFYLNDYKYDQVNTYFNLHYKRMLVLGKNSEYDKDYFIGKIYYIAFFNEPMGYSIIKSIYQMGYEKPDPLRKMKYITLDQRLCISSCANQATPGTPGSPPPPSEATSYYQSGVNNMIAGESNSLLEQKQGKTEAIEPLIEITCTKTVRELIKNEIAPNIKRRVKCPKECYKKQGPIFGTFVYTIDSSICISAIHAGIIKGITESNIQILTTPSLTFYQGSKQYNFLSASIDKAELSYQVSEATPVVSVNCKTTASESSFSGTIGMTFIVECPSDCSKISSNVFGGKPESKSKQLALYSGNSSICQSAIHAGVMNDRGGEVQFSIQEGAKLYYGSRAYGVESKSRDYFVKSITFFSSSNSLSASFNEDFKKNLITGNWDIEDNLQAEFFPSKWEYVPSVGLNVDSKFVLKQSSKIRVDSPLNYGSYLLLKNMDVVNVLFKCSFYFMNLSPVGMVFRYKNENNYYHLRINENSVGSYKVILVKKFEGKNSILATADMTIVPRLWYSFNVYQYFDTIKIATRIGNLKNLLTIMEVVDNDLQRGGLGLATNGNDDFYMSIIYVDSYEPDSPDNKSALNSGRNLEIILKENTKTHREKYCKSKYRGDYSASLECREFHNYCRMICDQTVHRREQILNFMCYSKCVKDAILKYKLNNIQQDALSFGIDSNVWTPKEGEKCDFKPDDEGNSYWTPCYVKQVKNNPSDPEQKFIQIKYNINNVERIGNILYPNITLRQCGEMLAIRKDCSSLGIDLPNLKDQAGGEISK